MHNFLRSQAALYLLFLIFVVCSLLVLDIRTLVPPDEGRYAEMAREMLLSGDWVTTRLNDIKYFEKPPLHTWMSALAFSLFGIGEWQARLWNGVCGIGAVLMVGYTGARVFGGNAGLFGAAMLASMMFWAGASQFNTLDISVAATMALALCALLIAQQDGVSHAQRRNWMLACWAGMALSLLAKGLIGLVLPAGVLGAYFLVAGDRGIWQRLHVLKGMALFLLLALPWFVLVAMRNPEQPAFFFIHEHWDRFFLKSHHREGPWYYFLVLLLPATLPWLPLLPASLKQAARRGQGRFQPGWLLLLWVVLILAFFSYSNSKLPGYMLPVFPALALLGGASLQHASRRLALAPPVLLALVGALGLLLLPMAGTLGLSAQDAALLASKRGFLQAAFVAALVGGAAAVYAEANSRRVAMVLLLAVAGWLMTQLSMVAYEPFGRRQSGKDLALMMQPELTATTPVYAVGSYEQSMTFYLRHTVTLVQYQGELAFGLQQEPERGMATLAPFLQRWTASAARGERQFAIVDTELYPELQRRGLPMRERGRNNRVVVVSSP